MLLYAALFKLMLYDVALSLCILKWSKKTALERGEAVSDRPAGVPEFL